MTKQKIIEVFRYEMAMLTFDLHTGEECEPIRYGENANRLFHALNEAVAILSEEKQCEKDNLPIPNKNARRKANKKGENG